LPAIELVHDKVEVPEPPAILVDESVHERFVELVETARVTVLENPLTGVMVIVDAPATLTLIETLVWLAVIAKSWAWNVTVAEWDRGPLVPVTVAR
jgi:hypothetical protein